MPGLLGYFLLKTIDDLTAPRRQKPAKVNLLNNNFANAESRIASLFFFLCVLRRAPRRCGPLSVEGRKKQSLVNPIFLGYGGVVRPCQCACDQFNEKMAVAYAGMRRVVLFFFFRKFWMRTNRLGGAFILAQRQKPASETNVVADDWRTGLRWIRFPGRVFDVDQRGKWFFCFFRAKTEIQIDPPGQTLERTGPRPIQQRWAQQSLLRAGRL